MDRLSPVVAVAVAALVFACGNDDERAHGSRQRVNAVNAKPVERPDPAEMCDVFPAAAKAPAFDWPKLTADPPATRAGEWRWINVWATWCKPCIAELPHLAAWRSRLVEHGAGVALHLISADESDEEITTFRRTHPETPSSMRLADPDSLPKWMSRLGVRGAGLPVHLFVDPSGRVRCVRASELEESDLPAIEALIR